MAELAGSARLVLVDGVALLRPEEQVFTAMLEGWRNQRLAGIWPRRRSGRERAVRAFTAHADAFPWLWTRRSLDEWLGDLRAVRGLRRSTVRGYQEAIRVLRLPDRPRLRLGRRVRDPVRHPPGPGGARVEHRGARQQAEGDPIKRAFTLDELQAFFDHADEQVARIRAAGRKGWLPAFRDATLFKIAYGYGLRRNETRMLDVADFGTNPHAPEFGEHGVCYVRHGKAMKGSAPKRRSVLTVWPWVGEVLDRVDQRDPAAARRQEQPGQHGVVALGAGAAGRAGPDRRPLRRPPHDARVGPGLDFHSLRRSYVTHLIEAGWDPLFVQHQVGHEHASTTAIYTCVSSDFRTRTLRRALDATLAQALGARQAGHQPTRPIGEQPMATRRQVSYQWRLREIMASRGLFTTTHLAPLLAERGITLSASQIHRLVTGTPERLSLPVLAALCDLLEVTPAA